MHRNAGSRYCPMAQGGGDCFPGDDFQSSHSSLTYEHLIAERNQVLVSCSRNSSFKSQDVSPFGPRGDGALCFSGRLGVGRRYAIHFLV